MGEYKKTTAMYDLFDNEVYDIKPDYVCLFWCCDMSVLLVMLGRKSRISMRKHFL